MIKSQFQRPRRSSSNVLEDQLQIATLSSKQEQARLNEEADVLREKNKRLREQADEIEREEKRLRKGASAAGQLHESLAFERLCLALRRNDTSTTEIKNSSRFPVGYAQSLGDALDKNTHVSLMEVSVKNSFVATANDEVTDDIRANIAPLLQYIEGSEALRSVSLYSSHPNQNVDSEAVRRFLCACFRNQHLDKLSACLDRIPAQPFDFLAHIPSSLKTIDVAFSKWHSSSPLRYYSSGERDMIGHSFRFFTSLTSLEVRTSDSLLMTSILYGLCHGARQLDELKLNYSDEEDEDPLLWSTLSTLLHGKSEFKHLLLSFFSFNDDNMEELINGFKPPDRTSVSSTTLSELSVTDCRFNEGARRLLVDFMHTRVPLQDECDTPATSSLTKLNVACANTYVNDLSSTTLVSMLRVQREEDQDGLGTELALYPTIGSQIQSLSIEPLNCFRGLLRRLARNADRIRLSTLTVVSPETENVVVALANCVSTIKTLRTVHVPDVCTSMRPLVVSLRQSETVSASIETPNFPTVTDSISTKLAKAYAERNQFLDELLLTSCGSEPDGDDDADASPDVATSVGSEQNLGMSFVSTLWLAAQQVPDTASSKVLRSLVTLCDRIGD